MHPVIERLALIAKLRRARPWIVYDPRYLKSLTLDELRDKVGCSAPARSLHFCYECGGTAGHYEGCTSHSLNT